MPKQYPSPNERGSTGHPMNLAATLYEIKARYYLSADEERCLKEAACLLEEYFLLTEEWSFIYEPKKS